jgi:DNA-binding PadR family transcriptional regulator
LINVAYGGLTIFFAVRYSVLTMNDSAKVPFYILGFLQRLGPLHGYQLKSHIEEQAGDFSKIKLPNLYYHLNSMKDKGWIESRSDRDGSRPEKEVYSLTQEGRSQFDVLLVRCLEEPVMWDFALDGVLFFSSHIPNQKLLEGLVKRRDDAATALNRLQEHKGQIFQTVPRPHQGTALLLLSHHESHYQSEIQWTQKAIEFFAEKGVSI